MSEKNSGQKSGERIAKRLARAGLCSRREAEAWILAGRVNVDGVRLTTPACVVTAKSKIEVDGHPLLEAEATRLFRYHKPVGLLTTNKDPAGRPTVFENLPRDLPRVVSVGRLDFTSEGLLLLTNDGEFARYLELPATALPRQYRVRTFGPLDERQLKNLAHGITVDGVVYEPIAVKIEQAKPPYAWLHITLHEGKNREIRKVLAHLGLQVARLIRIAYGPVPLGKLSPSAVEEVPASALRSMFKDFFTQNKK